MPKTAKLQTAATLAKISPPETGIKRIAVGGVAGLEMQISSTNARSWVLRGSFGGKRVNRGIGSCADMSLAEAREEARAIKQAWRDGRDLKTERSEQTRALLAEAQSAIPFAKFYPPVVHALTADLTSAKAKAQWTSTIERYAVPVIGKIAVRDISVNHIVDVLRPIWSTKHDTSTKLRSRLERIIDNAIALGLRADVNPAQLNLIKAVLGAGNAVVEHRAAVFWKDAPLFYRRLSTFNAPSYAILRVIMLTAARSGEARGMRWDEIDGNTWTIPAERTKTRRIHRTPLSPAALDVINNWGDRSSELVFPAPMGGVMTDAAVSKSMRVVASPDFTDKDSGKLAVVHGLRGTFRTWAQEANVPNDIAEECLAHVRGDAAERAYKRSDRLAMRFSVFSQYADFLGKSV